MILFYHLKYCMCSEIVSLLHSAPEENYMNESYGAALRCDSLTKRLVAEIKN